MLRANLHRWRAAGPTLRVAASILLFVLTIPACDAVRERLVGDPLSVRWEKASPEDEGLDGAALDRLGDDLVVFGTKALLVARGGRLVFERYGGSVGPNVALGSAAMTKPLVGIPCLLVMMTDRLVELDDPVTAYVPELASDTVRSRLHVRDLAFHTNGIENISFPAGKRGDLEGWKKYYYEHPDERFRIALFEAPILFPPGTDFAYSGVGYYALAYVLTRALRGAPESDLHELYRRRVMEPLGVPETAWQMSYGHGFEAEGTTFYAIGSGGKFTARAAARIGQLLLDRGRFGEKVVLAEEAIEQIVGPSADVSVSVNHGWALNVTGDWPSLPRDAFVGVGANHQVTLVVPSLDLVLVRNGASLAREGEDFTAVLDERLFAPLIAAVRGPSSRTPPPSPAPSPPR